MPSDASLLTAEHADRLVVSPIGEWRVSAAAALDEELQRLEIPPQRPVTIDLGGISRIDSAGAWLLLRTAEDLAARGNVVELRNLAPGFEPLFAQVRAGGRPAPVSHPRPDHYTLIGFVARIGAVTVALFVRAYALIGFVGLVSATAFNLLLRPRRLRPIAIAAQIEQTGVDALAIVGLLSFLVGIVIAYQGADQLRRFGAEIYTVDLLGVSILRELGVLMTAIMLAGRSGSAFTAQIGTMQINQEIDAMRTLGLDPAEVLVMPRLLGLLVTLPLLTVFADLMGLLGGGLMAWSVLGITAPEFIAELHNAVRPRTFFIGLFKAPFFAGIIAMIGCYEGFQVSRSAESVGRQTTLSVVESIFLVIVTDAIFSVLFSTLRL
jgi:phospholipid/cholesterol/gamma-HCH transport system permease protein